MRIAILFIFLLLVSLPGSLRGQGRTWDPSLLEASDLTYQGDFQKARGILEKYIKNNPTDPNGYFLQAVTYDWERNLTSHPAKPLKQKAIELNKIGNQIAFQRWHLNQDNVDRLIDFGNSYIFLGRTYSEAGSNMRGVLTAKKGPKHLRKALTENPQRKDGLLALGSFNYLADATPGYLAPLKGLFGIKGDKAKGLAQLETASQYRHPFQNDAMVALYYISIEFEKNYSRSIAYLAQLQEKFSENPRWQLAKGEAVSLQDKGQAIPVYLHVVEWCKKRPGKCDTKFPFQGFFNAGKIFLEQGKTQNAKKYLTQALQFVSPHDKKRHAQTLYLLGEIEQSSGSYGIALEHFHKANSIDGTPKSEKKKINKAIHSICKTDPGLKNC